MFKSFLQEIFLVGGEVVDSLPLIGVDKSFLMFPGFSFLDVVELTDKVDSFSSIVFSETIEASSYP